MSLVGYPDFQEQAQWQSPPAVVYSAAIANGATKIFPTTGNNLFNVSNWANTQLRVFGQFARLDVECQWYDADPPTALLGHRYWTTCANGSDSNVNIPNIGPYLRVNITNLSGAVPTLVAVIAFSNRVTAPFVCPSALPIVESPVALLAAGGIRTANALYLYSGAGTVFVRHDSTEAWTIYGYGVTSNGTPHSFFAFGYIGAAIQNQTIAVTVPPLDCHIELTNNGAGAHNFEFGMTADVFR